MLGIVYFEVRNLAGCGTWHDSDRWFAAAEVLPVRSEPNQGARDDETEDVFSDSWITSEPLSSSSLSYADHLMLEGWLIEENR